MQIFLTYSSERKRNVTDLNSYFKTYKSSFSHNTPLEWNQNSESEILRMTKASRPTIYGEETVTANLNKKSNNLTTNVDCHRPYTGRCKCFLMTLWLQQLVVLFVDIHPSYIHGQ